MRIVIDMQGAQTESRFRGIGSYSLNFAKAVIENRGEHEVHLVLNGLLADSIGPTLEFFQDVIEPPYLHIWTAPAKLVLGVEKRDLAALASLEILRAFIANLQPDIVHVTSLFEGYQNEAVTNTHSNSAKWLSSVTLYDLIPYANPKEYLDNNSDYAKFYLKKINELKTADICLAISDYSKNEFIHSFPESTSQTVNISAGISPQLMHRNDDQLEGMAVDQRLGIYKKFLLYAGGSDKRKNLSRLIEAFSKLHLRVSEPLQLVFAGHMDNRSISHLRSIAKKYGLASDELVFTGFVPSEVLSALYAQCACFVFPSWHEGFGLPALEAMANGAPVIAANSSSLPEVIGIKEALFDPFNADAILEKIVEVVQNKVLRDKLIQHGLERSKLFSWEKTAHQAISVWESASQKRHHTMANASFVAPSQFAKPKLAFVSPLPPARTGIADYSALLLQQLRHYYDIELILEEGVSSEFPETHHLPFHHVSWFLENHASYDRIVYQMGNSPFHWSALEMMKQVQGVTVLHDIYLSGLISWLDTQGGQEGLWPRTLYRHHGYGAVRDWADSREQAKLVYPVNWDVFAYSKAIITHSILSSTMTRQWYGDKLAQKVKAIPLVREAFKNKSRERARKKLNIADSDFVICSFGFLDPSKQNLQLLEAWMQCQERAPNANKLIFVGQNEGGNYGSTLSLKIRKSGLNNKVFITGFVQQEEYVDYLLAADIAVQLRTSSRGETSAAALDCLTYGLPLIVNSNGTMAELPNQATLKLPDLFSIQDLALSIEKLMNDASLRRQMSESGVEFIQANHSPTVCAAAYHAIIENAYLSEAATANQVADQIAPLLQQIPRLNYLEWADCLSLNFPYKPPGRNLFLDVSATRRTDRHTGIERVARTLCQEFLRKSDQEYRAEPVGMYCLGGRWHARYETQFALNLMGIKGLQLEDDVVEVQPGDVYLIMDLTDPEFVAASQSGFFMQLRHRGVKVYAIVYDLLPIKLPQVFPAGAHVRHEKWLQSVSELDGAICISNSVKEDLRDWCQSQASFANHSHHFTISSFELGFDFLQEDKSTQNLQADPALLKMFGARKTFLSVGTLEPRKNYLQTLDAFSHLWLNKQDVNWVIVGREGWTGLAKSERKSIMELIEKISHHPENGKRLFWINDADDERLSQIYASANCLLTNSLGEGLGLPLIEAVKFKLPQLIRDLPVFREIAGHHAVYFKAETAQALSNSIANWLLTENQNRPDPSNIRVVTWKDSVEQIQKIILRSAVTAPAHSSA